MKRVDEKLVPGSQGRSEPARLVPVNGAKGRRVVLGGVASSPGNERTLLNV